MTKLKFKFKMYLNSKSKIFQPLIKVLVALYNLLLGNMLLTLQTLEEEDVCLKTFINLIIQINIGVKVKYISTLKSQCALILFQWLKMYRK